MVVGFSFYDNSRILISNIDGSNDLPDKVASIEISGPFDSNTSNYKFLTTMLKNTTRKLKEITVSGLAEESPEFLAFLVLIYNKTNSLHISECPLSTNSTSCLMTLLLARDGIRCLRVSSYSETPMATAQATILLEGVASSPSLESFDFGVSNLDSSKDVGRCLIQALRRNQSLKEITILTSAFSANEFPYLLKGSTVGSNVKALKILDRERDVEFGVLQDALGGQDCTLEKLHLEGVSISSHGSEGLSSFQNVSVTSLTVNDTSSDWHTLTQLIGLFKSLEELDLVNNGITQLSFLEPLLFCESSQLKSSQLKSLDLVGNRIGEEEMVRFIEKLRQVRGLKYLAVGENDWVSSDSAKAALIDALRHNEDLEYLDLERTNLPLDLNRGGRRVFESSKPFPMKLLPHVLEGASKISYYKYSDCWGIPTNKEARADVVFWMIHRLGPHV